MGAPMDATHAARERFVAAVTGAEVALDVAALCIAAHAHPGLDVDVACRRLDDLAAACPQPTFDGVRAYLFDECGFTGDRDDYGDPENSCLDAVLDRRRGIPITLAIVMMEVGRRLGVGVEGVGMPGHFVVHDPARPEVWCDPFGGGEPLDADACHALFARLHGAGVPFDPAYLAPVRPLAIVSRVLTNLELGRLGADPLALRWMCDLHLALPGLPEPERRRLGAAVASVRSRWN